MRIYRTMHIYRNAIVAGALAGMLLGCQPAHQTAPALPPIQSDADTVSSVTSRVADASKEIVNLETVTEQLPGANETEHRQLMANAFGEFGLILPMIEGPNGTGAFHQQIRLIDTTSSQLQSLGQDVSAEPTTATGLRATYNALTNTTAEQFSDQADISKKLTSLGATLDELDLTQGPLVRQVQTEAIRQITTILQQMHAVLAQRMGTPAVHTITPTTKATPTTQH